MLKDEAKAKNLNFDGANSGMPCVIALFRGKKFRRLPDSYVLNVLQAKLEFYSLEIRIPEL